jgi:hypothetical protein
MAATDTTIGIGDFLLSGGRGRPVPTGAEHCKRHFSGIAENSEDEILSLAKTITGSFF